MLTKYRSDVCVAFVDFKLISSLNIFLLVEVVRKLYHLERFEFKNIFSLNQIHVGELNFLVLYNRWFLIQLTETFSYKTFWGQYPKSGLESMQDRKCGIWRNSCVHYKLLVYLFTFWFFLCNSLFFLIYWNPLYFSLVRTNQESIPIEIIF